MSINVDVLAIAEHVVNALRPKLAEMDPFRPVQYDIDSRMALNCPRRQPRIRDPNKALLVIHWGRHEVRLDFDLKSGHMHANALGAPDLKVSLSEPDSIERVIEFLYSGLAFFSRFVPAPYGSSMC